MSQFQVSQSRAVQVRAVADLLRTVAENEIVGYDRLSSAAGVDVQRRFRHILVNAQRDVLDQDGRLFVSERNLGLRLLPKEAVAIAVPANRRQRIRSQALRGTKELMKAIPDTSVLSPGAKAIANGHLALSGAILALTGGAVTKTIAAECATEDRAITNERIFDLFRKDGIR